MAALTDGPSVAVTCDDACAVRAAEALTPAPPVKATADDAGEGGRLRGEVAFAHNPALFVDGHLTGDVDGTCTGGGDDVGIGRIVV